MRNKDRSLSLDDMSRRQFMANVAKAGLGLSILPMAGFLGASEPVPSLQGFADNALRKPTARNVVYLYMAGGMSHLDTFDTKPESKHQGPVKSIKSAADGVQVSEYLPLMAQQMKHVAVINSMFSDQGAHGPGNYFMHTSYRQRATITHPTIGSWLMNIEGQRNDTLPGNVLIGGGSDHPGAGFMETKFSPLPIGDPKAGLQHSRLPGNVSQDQFKRRLELSEHLNNKFKEKYKIKPVRAYSDMYHDALALMKSKDLAAFDISKEPKELLAQYGDNSFGQGCLLSRRLIEHGVRYIEVNLGGWDTHNDNFENVSSRCQTLDRAMSTLIMDLERRGLLEETIVVLATEFGRTPTITETDGRNHHPTAFTCLLAGGGIQGGQKYGKSDANGAKIAENRVLVPDFNATIAYALGLPLDKTIFSDSGRPFTVAHKGKPLTQLF